MLNAELAEQFITKLASCTPYNINIMDRTGTIIASKDRDRIGTVHEIAYDIIQHKKDLVEVEQTEDLLGVRGGINMAVHLKNEVVGVIGITGKVADVRPIAQIMKASFETMLEYEAEKEKKYQWQGLRNEFLKTLLYQDNADQQQLQEACSQLGYRYDVVRVLIMFSPENPNQGKVLREQLKKEVAEHQDILSLTSKQWVVLCKVMPEWMFRIHEDYRDIINEYLAHWMERKILGLEGCRIVVGTPQKALMNYRQNYLHCAWMLNRAQPGQPIYFMDHIDEYMKNKIPIVELHKIFGIYMENLPEDFLKMFARTMSTLYDCNYNMGQASQRLNIHKNTLAFRLQKIRTVFNMNPMQNMRERAFLEYFLFYVQHRKA